MAFGVIGIDSLTVALLVEARVRLACVNIAAMKPVRMPQLLSAALSGKISETTT